MIFSVVPSLSTPPPIVDTPAARRESVASDDDYDRVAVLRIRRRLRMIARYPAASKAISGGEDFGTTSIAITDQRPSVPSQMLTTNPNPFGTLRHQNR